MSCTIIPVTYGYAPITKSDHDEKNLETQPYALERHGVRKDLIFVDDIMGTTFKRPGWEQLVERVQPGDTIVVCNLARFSRNFEAGGAIEADLTRRKIWIISLQEGINTADVSAGAKHSRRSMLAHDAFLADSTSEQIHASLNRARAEGKKLGLPPALTPDQIAECQRVYAENPADRRVARIMKVSQGDDRQQGSPARLLQVQFRSHCSFMPQLRSNRWWFHQDSGLRQIHLINPELLQRRPCSCKYIPNAILLRT